MNAELPYITLQNLIIQLLYQNLTGSASHLQGTLLSTLHIRILNTKQVLFIALWETTFRGKRKDSWHHQMSSTQAFLDYLHLKASGAVLTKSEISIPCILWAIDLAEKYRRAMASFKIRETKSGPLLRTFLNSLMGEQVLSHGKVHVYRQVAPSCFSICLVCKTTLDIVSTVYRKYIQEFLLYNFHTESYTLKIHTFAWDFTFLTSCQESLHI